ncbi:hypothetical protein [uncultured Tenacibaculum sp.]|uniref:hypothetical protein n=1 Tax=uncultured Tenacibaculum sp. TaxID=174713 RepID=UPI0026073E19|nr:hypothetical protein [uncultured Tenacibaculum sp.]
MKRSITLLLFVLSAFCFSQNNLKEQLEVIEKKIKSVSITDFQKLEVDLDNDNDLDYIYLYACAEPNCIEVYLNINQNLKKVIHEFCNNYYLYDGKQKDLVVKQNHCCGESPFTSHRVFNFQSDTLIIKENYVIFNESYELLKPETKLPKTYTVKTINDNYNIRFSPNIKKYSESESAFSCVTNTNIIGKLKKGSTIKVLSELIKKERIWLFVEIESESLNNTLCYNPINYEFKKQKLRGWISNNFVEKI